MSAPASLHHEHAQALDQLARALVRVLESAAARAATTDTAGTGRPLPAGAQTGQHDARAIPTKGNAGAAGDDHRDQLTTADV